MEKGVEKTTIRTTPEIREAYEEDFDSFYIGAKIAVNVFPYFRNTALQAIKDIFKPEEFEHLEKLVTDRYLKEEIMTDPVSMVRCITKQQEIKKLNIDFEDLKTKINETNPIHLFFLFYEIKRYRKIAEKVPGYRAKQFFKSEL